MVPFHQASTCGTGVHVVESQSVSPTIVHVGAIVGDDDASGAWGCSVLVVGGRSGMFGGSWVGIVHNGDIGTVEAALAIGQLSKLLLVFAGEVEAKFNKHLISHRANMPGVACHAKDTVRLKEQ